MNNDTLTRARAVLATIRATREARYLAASEAWDETLAPVIELDATPVLVRLAEAVGRLAGTDRGWGVWWCHEVQEHWPACVGCDNCGKLSGGAEAVVHDADCPALAIDAALAELAALDGGEVGR